MEHRIASRLRDVEPSPTLGLTRRMKQIPGSIAFAAGEPDFDTPEHIKEAAREALARGMTKYTPSTGIPELKEAVVATFERELGVRYTPEQVVITCGAKHALYNIFQVLLEPGDAVLIPTPYWVTYPEQVRLAHGTPVFLPTEEAEGFQVSPEAVEEACRRVPQARALILNSPSNPTGAVYTPSRLEAIAEVAQRHRLYLISDEIYRRLIYDGAEHVSLASFPGMKERTFLVDGVAKTYSMTGWRIGYVAAPLPFAQAMGLLQDHSTSNPTSIAQWAALAALTGDQGCVEAMRQAFDRRRQRLMELLEGLPGVTCFRPQGAFYAFPNLREACQRGGWKGASEFAEALLEEAKVGVVPGEGFGAPWNVRFSYATSMEAIEEGLRRVREFLERRFT